METREKLFIRGINVYLEKAEFNGNSALEGDIQININQKIEVLSCKKNSIKIRMIRHLESSEEEKPIVYVSAIAIFNLSEDSFSNFENLKDMEKYVEDKAGFLVDKIQMGSELSRIIANLTGTFGNPPLILPPIINKETMNK